MRRYTIAALGLCAAVAGCARKPQPPADQPRHALLDSLAPSPPPLNRPVSARPAPAPPGVPQLPGGEVSAVLLTRDGRPFQGTLDTTGRLSVTADRVRLDIEGGGGFEIAYRLPSPLAPLPLVSGAGRVNVLERSGPEGADRHVIVRIGTRLLLAETWRRSADPVVFDLGGGLRLAQGAARPAPGRQYAEVPVRVVEGQRVLAEALAIGQATSLETRMGRISVLVEVSHLLTPPAQDRDQVAGGYILRAWVVGPGG